MNEQKALAKPVDWDELYPGRFLKAGEFSFGLQAGAKSINAVYVLMDQDTARLLFRNRMNLGADAKVVAGIRAAEREALSKPLPADANVTRAQACHALYLATGP